MKTQPSKPTKVKVVIWVTKYKQYFPELCSTYAYLLYLYFFIVRKPYGIQAISFLRLHDHPHLMTGYYTQLGEDYWVILHISQRQV